MTAVTELAGGDVPMVNVRRFEASDVADCAAVIESALPQLAEANEAARALVRAHAAPHLLGAELAGYHTIVAAEAGRLLGLAALAGDEVRRVYVRPDTQGQGVGRRLMAELEREGCARGLGALRLTAGASAAGFYARLGYERLEEGAFVDGEARVAYVHMRKRLDAPRTPPAREP